MWGERQHASVCSDIQAAFRQDPNPHAAKAVILSSITPDVSLSPLVPQNSFFIPPTQVFLSISVFRTPHCVLFLLRLSTPFSVARPYPSPSRPLTTLISPPSGNSANEPPLLLAAGRVRKPSLVS